MWCAAAIRTPERADSWTGVSGRPQLTPGTLPLLLALLWSHSLYLQVNPEVISGAWHTNKGTKDRAE